MASFRPTFDWQAAAPAVFSPSTKAREALKFDISTLDEQRKAVLGNNDEQSVAQAGCLTNMIAVLEEGCSKVMLRFTEQHVQQECTAAYESAKRIHDAFEESKQQQQQQQKGSPRPDQRSEPLAPPAQEHRIPPAPQQQQQPLPLEMDTTGALVPTQEPVLTREQAIEALQYVSNGFLGAMRESFHRRGSHLGSSLRMGDNLDAEAQANIALQMGEDVTRLMGEALQAFKNTQGVANASLQNTADDGLYSLVKAFTAESRGIWDMLQTSVELVQSDAATKSAISIWRYRFQRAVEQPQLLWPRADDGHRILDSTEDVDDLLFDDDD